MFQPTFFGEQPPDQLRLPVPDQMILPVGVCADCRHIRECSGVFAEPDGSKCFVFEGVEG